MNGIIQRIHMILALPPHEPHDTAEFAGMITALIGLCLKAGVHLTVTLRRGGEPALFEPESEAPDRLPPLTIRADLTDRRLCRGPASVLFTLLLRLRASSAVPVDFTVNNGAFTALINGDPLPPLPRHPLTLGDPYTAALRESWAAADERCSLAWRERRPAREIRSLRDALFEKESLLGAAEYAYLRLIIHAEELAARGALTETARSALDALAADGFDAALAPLEEGGTEQLTPDDILLRCFILRTHPEPGTWRESCLALEKAAAREAEQITGGPASTGAALAENLRRQTVRQDCTAAVTAADQCLRHPRLKDSAEVLLLKGMALTSLRRLPEAGRALDRAIALCRQEAASAPLTGLPRLALCLCEKARGLAAGGRIREAREALRSAEAVLTRETHGPKIPKVLIEGQESSKDWIWLQASFSARTAAARLLRELCRLQAPDEPLNESAERMKRCRRFLPEPRRGYPDPAGVYRLAEAYNLSGLVYLDHGEDNKVSGEFTSGRRVIEELRFSVPDAYPVLLADLVNNHGILMSGRPNHMYEAKHLYQSAAEILEREAPPGPEAAELLGDCFYNLALLYQDWDKKKKAEEYLLKARAQYLAAGRTAAKEKLRLVAEAMNDPG